MNIGEVVFAVYAVAFLILLFGSIFSFAQELIHRAEEDVVSIVGSTTGVIFLVIILIGEVYFNFLLSLGHLIGAGPILEHLSLGILILYVLFPLLLVTIWRHLELVLVLSYRSSNVNLPPVANSLEDSSDTLLVKQKQEQYKTPNFLWFLRAIIWAVSFFLVGVASVAAFVHLQLQVTSPHGQILHYVQLNPAVWGIVPPAVTTFLILIFGIIVVIWVSRMMKGVATEEKTGSMWCGIWMILGTIAIALGNTLGRDYILFTGNGTQLFFMFGLLMCERERIKFQHDRAAKFAKKNVPRRRSMTSKRLSMAMRV